MKVFFNNHQVWSVSGRFSVDQRRFAWTLRKHPKKFRKRKGPLWSLVRKYEPGDYIPSSDLSWSKSNARRLLHEALMDLEVISNMERKHDTNY